MSRRMMENRMWYIYRICAPYSAIGELYVVELSPEELVGAMRFMFGAERALTETDELDDMNVMIFDTIAYDTKEEAIEAIEKSQSGEYQYSFDIWYDEEEKRRGIKK